MRYGSRWDGATWFIVGLVAACCVGTCLMDDGIWPVVICLTMLAITLLVLLSVYYIIDGDTLIAHRLFASKSYPIDKIKEVKPTKLTLSAPATSFSHRLAITFTECNILKSSTPLIISPARQDEFLAQLIAINPTINQWT